MSEREQLKREIRRLARGRARRYPRELRARIEAYCVERRSQGASWSKLGDELGAPWETLRRWSLERSPSSTALVPVEVVVESLSEATVAVVSPTGWRLEGLDVRDAVAVLRTLS